MGPKLHYTFFLQSPHQPRYPDPYQRGTPKASNIKEIKGLHTHTHLLKKKKKKKKENGLNTEWNATHVGITRPAQNVDLMSYFLSIRFKTQHQHIKE